MAALSVDRRAGTEAFSAQLDRFVEVCTALSDHDLLAASHCWGWMVLDVVVHVRTGLQEMLGGLVTSGAAPADTDAASYWKAPAPAADQAADDVDGVLWTRRTASAYRRPTSAVAHLSGVAAAVSAAAQGAREGTVCFQGHVLEIGDFLATWAVELAVHHLDLTAHLALDPPAPSALRLTRHTIEALLGQQLPAELDDLRTALLATGRQVPSPAEARLLGHVTGHLPVLG